VVENRASDNGGVLRKRLFRLRLPAILVAVIACGAVVAGQASAADNSRPSKPSGLAKTGATETTVSLSWRASTDNVGVKGYRIFRNGTLAGSVTSGTTYVLTGLHCNTTYIVMVSAYDAAGNKSLPAAIFAKTAACGSDEPPCPTPSTVFRLLLEHQIQYGCTWPGGIYAKQALQSVRIMLAGRGIKLDTWRGKKWHKVALEELDAATGMANAWTSNGVLRVNSAGLAVQYKIGRVIRVLHWNNPELFEVSKAEKWALTAISWYISASEYNRQYAIVGATPTMNRALYDLKRADSDFFSLVCYRAWGRYRQVWQRVNGL
jgi:Fibronectin type III domain